MKQILSILIISGVFLTFVQCGKGHKSEHIEVKTPKSEPKFEKEGELWFTNASGQDTIKTIDIEIADHDRERMQGMMYRSSMDYGKGMLFVFNVEEEQSFWMKNCKLSLDIIYVNSDLEIVTIYKHTQPYSESPIPSFKPAQYVVETSAGFCDEFNIKEGDKIAFAKDKPEVPS